VNEIVKRWLSVAHQSRQGVGSISKAFAGA
jgi:hypothetical protein